MNRGGVNMPGPDDWLAALHRRAHALAFAVYLKKSFISPHLRALVEATASREALMKYNPNWEARPRAAPAAGNGPTAAGGAGRPGEANPYPDAITPLIPDGDAVLILSALPAGRALQIARIFLQPLARPAADRKLLRAIDAIEKFLGGSGMARRNKAGDIFIIRGDKKIRFDINKTFPHKEPHFHIEKMIKNGKQTDWVPAGRKHWYPFKKE